MAPEGDMAMGGSEAAPRRRNPWSVRKIAEEVAAQHRLDLRDVWGPRPGASPPPSPLPGSSPPPEPEVGLPSIPLEDFLAAHASPSDDHGSSPPGSSPTGRSGEGAPTSFPDDGPRPHTPSSRHRRAREERVYLSYLLLHLDQIAEPALRYLRHAVEEECRHRGVEP